MATSEEYAQWIVNNADKKGTPAFETVAAAYADSKKSSSFDNKEGGGFGQGVGNFAAGAARSAGGIGANIMRALQVDTESESEQRRANIDNALKTLGAQPDSWAFKGGRLATDVAGTAGAGGLIANSLLKFAPAAISNAPRVAKLLEAIKTGGFSLGNAPKGAVSGAAAIAENLGTRVAGGAISGGAQSGVVDTGDIGLGTAIGGAFPLAGKAIKGATGLAGDAYKFIKTPVDTRLANKLAESMGMTPGELVSVLQPGPMPLNNLPGYFQTVPQILQNPVTSQLQRTLKTAGANALGNAERAQQGAYHNALQNVAPIDISVQDAANRAGGAIQDYAIPARGEATKRVSRAFEAVDPFNESALHLPITEMEAQQSKYLGSGTFGTGSKAASAIAEAKRVGTDVIPGIDPLARESASNSQTLEQAVRSMGGMKGGSGELRDLGIKQSGTTGLVNNKSGKSADLVAEEMHRRGFISDSDPATLFDALRNGGGRKIFANDQVESNSMQRMYENTFGDLPVDQIVSKAVPFQTVQNLRSSLGEAAEQAEANLANKEAAALRAMIQEIDSRINRAAGGSVGENEFFPKDMADQYRSALKLHADKMQKFETGPQVGMFRKGGDNQAAIQGAEIPGKFFSGRRSQVEDMKSLKRLIGDQPALMEEMKRYAMTEGANTATNTGNLTSKFIKWLESRSGANAELFTKAENETLKSVGDAVQRGINAESLGIVNGSDTAQKLASLNSLGLLDSGVVKILSGKVPFAGTALSGLRETAERTRNNALSKLLSSPEETAIALSTGTPQSNALLGLMDKNAITAGKFAVPLAMAAKR